MNPRSMLDELFADTGIRVAVVGVLAILSLFLFALTMRTVQDFGRTDTANVATITVTGTGKASATPNVAHISFSVTETGATTATAQDAATKRTDTALAAIKKLGIAEADIQTSGYSISPQYATQACPPGALCPQNAKITGYQASESIEVKVRDTKKAGEVLQALGSAGVQNVSGPDFMVDDTAGVDAEARGKAIADARAKAEILASQLGVHLGKVVGFSENGGGIYPMYASGMAKNTRMDAVMPAPSLPVGTSESNTSVTVIYEIR